MKISWRIFCTTYLVIFSVIAVVCLVLVEQNNAYLWNRTKEEALVANETAGQLFILFMDGENLNGEELEDIQKQIANTTLRKGQDSFLIVDKEHITGYDETMFVNQLSAGQQGYRVVRMEETPYFQAVCAVEVAEECYYLQTLVDLTDIYVQRENSFDFCRVVVLAAAFIGGVILLIISHFIAVPIKSLSRAVNRVSAGNYGEKIAVRGSLELVELASDFNHMAGTIQTKIDDLNEEIRRREQFIADFTHELKTPMTTIIGYADMLRSYDLTREEKSESANSIYREAKRLERLSMRLLELLVLEKEVPVWQKIHMELFLQEISRSTHFLSEKYGVNIIFDAEPVVIEAEPELLASLLYNLIDNACKASDSEGVIRVSVCRDSMCRDSVCGDSVCRDNMCGDENRCRVSVKDYGRGIGEAHIKEVTEPFYMEDKSRSRGQGGAGLGLALCRKIVDVHRGTLQIDSVAGKGTTVCVWLPMEQDTKGADNI